MNTKSIINGKSQRRQTAQNQGAKKQAQKRNMLRGNPSYHEQERIETRMTD